MSVDVPIPTLGESVSEGVIVRWLKADGDAVKLDEPLFELETDKASVEIPAPDAGVVHILKPEGTTVQVGDVVATIEAGDGAKKGAEKGSAVEPSPTPAATPGSAAAGLSPAVRRLVEENDLDPGTIAGSGRGGRLTKADVMKHLAAREEEPAEREEPPAKRPEREEPPAKRPEREEPPAKRPEREEPRSEPEEPARARPTSAQPEAAPREPTPYPPRPSDAAAGEQDVERVPMTRLRQRIAERLLQAQRSAAILSTFNEVDMSAVISLRAKYKESFAAAHGASLGFMSFFARACFAAIRDVPVINSQIDGDDVVHYKRVNLGVAVGTERGLVVPILPAADLLSFADLEKGIARLARLARDNKLAIADLSGGTFTISNGGVYGSLLSTPILNPPQSAILGMHKIEQRPVAIDGEVVVRPMMYVALSYDHRLIDGAEAVTFLVRVKERLENPERLLLDI